MKKKSLKFLEFENENAWMEPMKGKRWDTMVEKENEIFKKKVEQSCSQDELAEKINEFKTSLQPLFFNYENILLEEHSSSENYFHLNNKKYLYVDLDIYNKKIYYINDIGKGSLKYRFNASSWYIDDVGDTFFIKNDIIYILKAEKQLWYNRLIAYSLQGKFLKEIYVEDDHTYNLSLVKGENSCLFLIRENAKKQDIFVIEDLNIIYSDSAYERYYPIGFVNNKICYFYYDKVWKPYGFLFKFNFKNNIVYVNLQHKIIVLKEFGKNIVYNFSFKELFSFYGLLHLHPLSYKLDALKKFYIDFSDRGVLEMKYFKEVKCVKSYATISEHNIERVHYIVLKPLCKMKGIIVVGYGAYGMPTNTSTRRWKPYLENGWGIAFAFIRGGGDVDLEWENDGKTYNKIHSIEDFELVIQDIQRKYNISPDTTCIFGRSAGGYLIGSAIARNPNKNLFKIVYTEVPYVDVLQTTTNPSLPLTELEYNEFGNPKENIYELQKILEISPVDSIDEKTPPDIYILIRTSKNDTQVYAYESYKWLYKLRGKNKNDLRKIIHLNKNSGHFVIGDTEMRNFSEDFFLLKSFRDNGK